MSKHLFFLVVVALAFTLHLASSRAVPGQRHRLSLFSHLAQRKIGVRNVQDDKPMIRGTNLGGWLVMEPWITPSIFNMTNHDHPDFDGTNQIVDEWTFWEYGNRSKVDYIQLIYEHWEEWVTEDHIRRISETGCTHIRIPVGYWLWDINDDEPFTNGREHFNHALDQLKNVLGWATKHNLKVLFDLHCAPGSQNGFDNSGRRGDVHLLDGNNLERTERVVQKMSDWAAANTDAATLFGIELLNEPNTFNQNGAQMWDTMKSKFYPTGYTIVRNATKDVGAVNSTAVVAQIAFRPFSDFKNVLQPYQFQNVFIDDHNYQCFGGYNNDMYDGNEKGWEKRLSHSCDMKSNYQNTPLYAFVGEFSLAVTDCTKWLLSVDHTATPINDGRADICDFYNADVADFPPEYREFLRNFASAQMDAFEEANGWLFWNFRTEASPEWDFLLGVEEGWIPVPVNKRQAYDCGSD